MTLTRNNPFVTISQAWATYAPDGRAVHIRRAGTGWQVGVDGADAQTGVSLADLLALVVGVHPDDEWTARIVRQAEKDLAGSLLALAGDPQEQPRPMPAPLEVVPPQLPV